jgi:hypothetical protein
VVHKLQVSRNKPDRGPTALPKAGASPKGETTDSIAVVVALNFLFSFSAQKSHVKPQNHLNPYHPTTSTWHFSYTQPAILDI